MQSLGKERSPYVLVSSSTVVLFDVSRVALAENQETAPFVDELLRRIAICSLEILSLRSGLSRVSALNMALGAVCGYMDQTLKRGKRLCAKFIHLCLKCHIVELGLRAKSTPGAFFARKKDGRQRMNLDCRPCNRMFRDPPGKDLIAGEGLGEICIIGENFKSSS